MRLILAALLLIAWPVAAEANDAQELVEEVFDPATRNLNVMRLEAAIAQAQADAGMISQEAAAEIAATANLDTVPLDAVEAEYDIVRHRMVALLNVWRRSLSPEAAKALHFGVTTVDIYDGTRVLQMLETLSILRSAMRRNETAMMEIAIAHRDTLMVGRTLGQHALPITFGKKVAVWAAANRRHIERIDELACRLRTLGVLRGAVGSHVGLGPQAIEVEHAFARELGLGPVNPADWHGHRDVFGEYGQLLALISRSYAGIGQEIWMLQMTDIGEVVETRPAGAQSSSTMPHKVNPSRSEALMHWGRVIPAHASILIDDVANMFERDNTSRPNATVEDISIAAAEMVDDMAVLLRRIEVNEERMRENLDRTDGMILAQRIVFHVQDDLGREHAEELVAAAARRAMEGDMNFRAALLADAELGPLLADEIDALLDPATYTGLAAEQVDATVRMLSEAPTSPCGS
ncbi:lyase family protein [Sphingomicrobium sediminis]|uniref:Lyase family protein n=1 Tax=Sphingomicrobium sediminis TaxID=2950949 RepID=A0A9X2EIP1_9SPHN|nr:lyase family protein [Sphingomicrobium sediminis]MCM8558232.1 lyase family protein [Sphingomicrobium sediminis]